MPSYRRFRTSLGLLCCAGALAACAGQPISDSDRIATRVAEELAVSATLTAVAQSQPPIATAAATSAPVADAPTVAPATVEPPAPTAAPAEPATPTEIPIPPTAPPEPTEAPLAYTDVNFDGNPQPGDEVGGKIQIAGATLKDGELPLVRDQLAIRVLARFPNSAARDGDGVAQVAIRIDNNETGETVHEQIEKNASYCSFGGGEPDCTVWVFAEHNQTWPNGQSIAAGAYTANIKITPKGSSEPTVFWNFQFEVAQS